MKPAGLVKCAGALLVLAICSACSSALRPAQGDMAPVPSSAALNAEYIDSTPLVDGRPVTAARMNPPPPLRYATIVPDLRRSRKKFEYVMGFYGSYTSIFDYPKSHQQIGTIDTVGGQGCTNVLYGYGKRSFWIVAASNQITEYRVVRKPIKTLSVKYSFPTSCAMNASGDLAVGIYDGGEVVIFKNATGKGAAHPTALDEEFFDGYDPHGNLFADGFTGYRTGFALVELPKGGSKFKTITTSNSVEFPGSVQWDGTYVTVFDQFTNEFYQYTINGTKATLKNTVQITGAGDCAQTWIVKGLVYCGDAEYGGEVFKYPAGGSPVAVFTGKFNGSLGVTAARR